MVDQLRNGSKVVNWVVTYTLLSVFDISCIIQICDRCVTQYSACWFPMQGKVWPQYQTNKSTVGELWLGMLRYNSR